MYHTQLITGSLPHDLWVSTQAHHLLHKMVFSMQDVFSMKLCLMQEYNEQIATANNIIGCVPRMNTIKVAVWTVEGN